MLEFVAFIFACYGLTSILMYSSLFEKLRRKFNVDFFKCPLCIGFWSGIVVYSLFAGAFDLGILLIYGMISSGTTYILDKLFGDNGLKIEVHR